MEDQFVPYELAVKLKELGFKEKCFPYIMTLNFKSKAPEVNYRKGIKDHNSDSIYHTWISAPLWQQAFDWFRTKYNLGYSIHPITLDAFVTNINNAELFMLENNDSYAKAKLACLEKLIELIS